MNSLKTRLLDGTSTLGSWITLGHPAVGEIMARAGFDWLAVDLEHSVISLREAEDLIRVIDGLGCSPLIRLSANDPVQIKRVMDAGAHGVIVPMVNSAAEARRAVEAVRYPPRGRRGVGLARAQGYGSSFHPYLTWVDKQSVVIVQIEHIDAVRALEDILSTEGVDGFIVGPYDLSGSLGIPGQFEHPDMVAAMARIREVGGANGKAMGYHVVEPDLDQLQTRRDEGYRFLAYSLDIRMLDCACRNGVATIRGRLP